MSFGELWTWAPICFPSKKMETWAKGAFLPLSTNERHLLVPEMPAGTIIDAIICVMSVHGLN